MTDLLPVSQLQAFERAARHLSFTVAARDLNVHQPAVSRQVAALEARLGAQLFRRTKPRLTLTHHGLSLYRAISDGFTGIRTALRRISEESSAPLIVVNAAIGFTSLYLMPRLADFQAAFPDYRVQIVTRDQNLGYDLSSADVVITFGGPEETGPESRLIFQEELIAVCAPALLPGGTPLSLDQILRQRLLFMSSDDHADDWARYLQGTGIVPPEPAPTERIMSYMVYLTAIERGQGIGLDWKHLVDQRLRDKRLFLAFERTVITDRAYHARLTPRAQDQTAARDFVNWLAEGSLCVANPPAST